MVRKNSKKRSFEDFFGDDMMELGKAILVDIGSSACIFWKMNLDGRLKILQISIYSWIAASLLLPRDIYLTFLMIILLSSNSFIDLAILPIHFFD